MLIKAKKLKQTNGGVMPSEYKKIDNVLDIQVLDWNNRQRRMKDQWVDDEKKRLFEMC
jgi:hypothetical protein